MPLDSNPSLGTMPGTRGWPLIGNLPSLLPNPMPFIEAQHRRHGNVFFASFAMNQRAVFLLGPEAAELVLVDRMQIFSNKLAYTDQARFLGEQGLLFRDGKQHLALRRRLNRAFKPAALKTYLAIMNERISERVSSWAAGSQPRLAEEIRRLTLDIAAQAIAGTEVGPESDSVIRHFIHMLGASTSFGPALPGTAKWKGARGRAHMDRYFRQQIAERRAGAGEDMFSRVCQASGDQYLSDDEIVDNMIGGLLAAYETTATTLMMMLYFLARHPQWQERLRNEFTRTETLGRMRFDALDELVEAEWVLKETLRLNPPLPFLPRRATRSFEFDGHEVPAGASLIISPAFIHRMPSIYPNPDAFVPERFAESNGQDRAHPCAWIPFGKGSHTCMGMHMARLEVKAFFTHVLARFHIEVSQEHDLEMRYLPVMGPAGAGLPIRLSERKT